MSAANSESVYVLFFVCLLTVTMGHETVMGKLQFFSPPLSEGRDQASECALITFFYFRCSFLNNDN